MSNHGKSCDCSVCASLRAMRAFEGDPRMSRCVDIARTAFLQLLQANEALAAVSEFLSTSGPPGLDAPVVHSLSRAISAAIDQCSAPPKSPADELIERAYDKYSAYAAGSLRLNEAEVLALSETFRGQIEKCRASVDERLEQARVAIQQQATLAAEMSAGAMAAKNFSAALNSPHPPPLRPFWRSVAESMPKPFWFLLGAGVGAMAELGIISMAW